eukprot:954314-Rhodomonas_salina.1
MPHLRCACKERDEVRSDNEIILKDDDVASPRIRGETMLHHEAIVVRQARKQHRRSIPRPPSRKAHELRWIKVAHNQLHSAVRSVLCFPCSLPLSSTTDSRPRSKEGDRRKVPAEGACCRFSSGARGEVGAFGAVARGARAGSSTFFVPVCACFVSAGISNASSSSSSSSSYQSLSPLVAGPGGVASLFPRAPSLERNWTTLS